MSAVQDRADHQGRTISLREFEAMERSYKKVREALATEQAKSARFRRYIARMNHGVSNHGAMNGEDESQSTASMDEMDQLKELIKEQGALLNKLYQENRQQQTSLDRSSRLNRQLIVANDKLRQTLINLKKKAKSLSQETQCRNTLSERYADQVASEKLNQDIQTDNQDGKHSTWQKLKQLGDNFRRA